MKILVTGGAGFLGSTLVDRLIAEDHEVDVIDDLSTGSLRNLSEARARRSGTLKIHQCDIRDPGLTSLIERRAPQVVYHLGGHTAPRSAPVEPGDVASIDLAGTVQVLAAAAEAGVRKLVVAGAVPAGGASLTELVAEARISLVERARDALGLEATVVNLPTVYGPRQRPASGRSVVATFAERLASGRDCVIHGGGEQTRDLLFVDDAADALCRALDKGDGLTVDVGTGHQTSIASLYRALAAIAGVDAEAVPGALRPGEPGSVPVDPARARMYLGWEPYTDLAEGLAETYLSFASS